jgi:hypothetical protein
LQVVLGAIFRASNRLGSKRWISEPHFAPKQATKYIVLHVL